MCIDKSPNNNITLDITSDQKVILIIRLDTAYRILMEAIRLRGIPIFNINQH